MFSGSAQTFHRFILWKNSRFSMQFGNSPSVHFLTGIGVNDCPDSRCRGMLDLRMCQSPTKDSVSWRPHLEILSMIGRKTRCPN